MYQFQKSSFALLMIFFVSCAPQKKDGVKTTYIHQYGIELKAEDFFARGGNGEVVTSQADGVRIRNCYQNGLLHGLSSWSFPHSDLIARTCRYEEGNLVEETLNWDSGVPKQKNCFEEDGIITSTGWYEEGSPRFVEHRQKDRILDGEYYTRAFELESSIKTSCGIRSVRDRQGTLELKETYVDGAMTQIETFYPNGSPSAQIPYVNGKIEGVKKTFLEGGEPNTVEEWKAGVLDGTFSQYQNGVCVATIPYIVGKKQGKELHFNPDSGAVVEELLWDHDVAHGVQTRLVDGKTIQEWYFKGQKLSEQQYLEKCSAKIFGQN